jgi:non-ribosomal peptide synthetase component F
MEVPRTRPPRTWSGPPGATPLEISCSGRPRRHPDKIALISQGIRWSHAEFDAAVNRTAHALRGRDLSKGDRLALLSHDSWQWAVLARCPEHRHQLRRRALLQSAAGPVLPCQPAAGPDTPVPGGWLAHSRPCPALSSRSDRAPAVPAVAAADTRSTLTDRHDWMPVAASRRSCCVYRAMSPASVGLNPQLPK